MRLLYASTITPYKNQPVVIRAVAELVKQGRAIELLLAGDGDRRGLDTLNKEMSQLPPAIASSIKYCGFVPAERIPALYHAADAFIFASSCENQPNILIEAMASGLPIASSRVPPMPEVLGDAGVYFDPACQTEVIAAVEALYDNRDLRWRIAALAVERSKTFDWTGCAEQTFEFMARCYGATSQMHR